MKPGELAKYREICGQLPEAQRERFTEAVALIEGGAPTAAVCNVLESLVTAILDQDGAP